MTRSTKFSLMVFFAVAVSVVVAAPNPNADSPAALAAADHDWNIRYKKKPSDEEMDNARRWAVKKFAAQEPGVPFSFVYDGRASDEFLKTWNRKASEKKTDGSYVRRNVVYTDPKTGLKVECKVTEYVDVPAIEWVLFFENTGPRDTPILSDVNPADMKFPHSAAGEFVLHYADGSEARATDFRPRKMMLSPKTTKTFTPNGGRSSNAVLPYFNVAESGTGGTILAIGWTGEWRATFVRDAGTNLFVRAGMQSTHLRLHPGERIRTPAMLLLFYRGDRMRGQNLFRNLMLRHYTPTPGGLPVNPPVAASGTTIGYNNITEANQIQAVTNIIRRALPVDTYWVDAGWSAGGFPDGMGTLDPDPVRFPKGLKPLADAAHTRGLRFLLWFEPERVMPGTRLRAEHPDWLLAPGVSSPVAYDGKARLLNMGDEKARAWLTHTVSTMIRRLGMDVYRHDCNIQPLFYWRAGEREDRRPMTEIRYIEGLYAFFDALLREHPRLLLDNCASGGRRLDFEMMRRSLPLWRSDYCWKPVGQQCMTYGLSYWLPLHGVGAVACDAYNFRSGMGANMSFAFDYYSEKAAFWEELSRRIKAYRRIRDLFVGDYYPLTPYSTEKSAWIAWQFDRPDLDRGLVQAFRRADCPRKTLRLKLNDLDADARYALRNWDVPEPLETTGRALMSEGFDVRINERPGAAVVVYKKLTPRQ